MRIHQALGIFIIACTPAILLPATGALAFEWESAAPARCGLDSLKLERMTDSLAARGTRSLLVVRGDRIAWEWYSEDFGPERRHYTASLAKALVGGMSLLLALDDNRLRPDDPAADYIPVWRGDPLREKITIRHLATHSSGIEDAETEGLGHFEQRGWKLRFWSQDPDPFTMSVRQAPVIFEPGSDYHYSNPGMGALSYAVTSSYRGTAWSDIRSLLKQRVMDPIGVPEDHYSMGYGRTFEVDGLRLVPNWGGGSYTARAVARVGRLLLHRGEWEGRQLISAERVGEVTGYAGTPLPPRPDGYPAPAATLGFYTNYDGVWENVPRDAFAGSGAGNQVMVVIPSLDMIVVRNGEMIDTSGELGFWGGAERYLLDPLMDAVVRPPYPRSALIKEIRFEPVSGIECAAEGSDNWPITWADDGEQYTAYGDGWGFEPKVEIKLSNGIAQIVGPAEDFRGENIRTESGETIGDGREGAKASGMLMVDGVLYMLMRNVDNSQLWWSGDHGRTWEKGFRFTESFGCPSFIQYGRDYEGARDDYVYIYSHDGPSAYEVYDGVVLARAHRDRLKERGAWEFFSGTGSGGEPVWSSDIGERAHVFGFPGACHRLDAAWHPGLGRYLLAMASNHSGAWGIYEAPEPWGPWSTAFHTPYWGLGDTHGYRIPTKWISAGGDDFYLVFSGRPHETGNWDSFCVRRARVIRAYGD